MKILFLLIVILKIFLSPIESFSQQDSLGLSLNLLSTFSTSKIPNHYIRSNKFGIIPNESSNFVLQPKIFYHKYFLNENLKISGKLDWLINNNTSYFQQYLAKIDFRNIFSLSFGAEELTRGLPYPSLSSGSLGLSNNARPMPRISVGIPEFVGIPFTFGYLEIKGMISHGWFEKDRIASSPLLHEKFVVFRAGGKLPVRFKAGLFHFAQWGGQRNGIFLGESIDDFFRVVFAKPSSSDESILFGEAANVLGNHLGTIDFGIEVLTNSFNFETYHQTPFEDNTGTKRFWRKNRDRLLGFKITPNKFKYVNNFLYEYVYTLQQTHPGLNIPTGNLPDYGYGYGGRDNYYNNYLYKSGWTYYGRILGTPLFDTNEEVLFYNPEFVDPDAKWNFKILNNRIKAHHFGIEGEISKTINYKFLSTFTENYGNYGGLNGGMDKWGSRDPNYNFNYYFDPPRKQWYFLLETNWHVPKWENFNFTTSLALDQGEMTDNYGIMLGIEYKPIMNINSKKQRKKSD